MKVSIYSKYNNPIPTKNVNIFNVLQSIKDGKYKNQIEKVRSLIDDKPKRDEEKKKSLQQATFCGTFTTRGNSNLLKFSGFACLDYDQIEAIEELTTKVNDDKYTFSSFLSPSGNGLKVLVKIPPIDNDDDYKSFYVELQKYYDKYGKTDDATKDIARATFLSYDPDLFINPESEMFTNRHIKKQIIDYNKVTFKIEDQDEIAQRLIIWFKKHWTTGENRNNNLFKLCSAFNDYGVNKSVAIDYCFQYQSDDFKEREIKGIVESAYKATYNFGTKAFEDIKTVEVVRKMVESGSNVSDVINRVGVVDGIEEIIDTFKSNTDLNVFWEIGDKGKIEISYILFDNYLKSIGISKYYPYTQVSDFDFIIRDKNFIDWIDTNRIKDIIKRDLISKGNYDIWDYMAKNNSIFKKDTLSMLDTVEINPMRDDRNSSFIFYKNKAVKTTKDNIELIDYKYINDVIWRNQVIDRNIDINDSSDGEFKTFIWRLSGEDKDRYYTLKSVIGYLLHSYQNDSKPKAIIFND
jgi:hypothetical protein